MRCDIMRRRCHGAVASGVGIGAHIGYRDLVGFGRRVIATKPADTADETPHQIGGLDALASLVTRSSVRAQDGTVIRVPAEGNCVHSNPSDAAGIARSVRAAQEANDAVVRAVT